MLDLVSGLNAGKPDAIRGKHSSGKGNESFRLYVTYGEGAISQLAGAKGFSKSDASMHEGMEASYRQDGYPNLQLVYDKGKVYGEVDIDFEHNFGGKLKTVASFGRKGALSRDNSNIEAHKKEYEKRYGQIPCKE